MTKKYYIVHVAGGESSIVNEEGSFDNFDDLLFAAQNYYYGENYNRNYSTLHYLIIDENGNPVMMDFSNKALEEAFDRCHGDED